MSGKTYFYIFVVIAISIAILIGTAIGTAICYADDLHEQYCYDRLNDYYEEIQ